MPSIWIGMEQKGSGGGCGGRDGHQPPLYDKAFTKTPGQWVKEQSEHKAHENEYKLVRRCVVGI